RDDFNAAFQNVVDFVDNNVGFATAKQPSEQLLKVAADRLQRRQKQLPAVDVDALNNPLQRCFGLDQVSVLRRKLLESGFNLVQFIERIEIDGPNVVNLVA